MNEMAIAKFTEPVSRSTIHDVALAAAVSTATVSRTLAMPYRVKPETRRRVQAAIEALGYHPDAAARSLASGRSRVVGLIVPTLDNASFARQIQVSQDCFHAAAHEVLVAGHDHDPVREMQQIQLMQRRGVDALVLVGTGRSPAIWSYLLEWSKPVVLTWTVDRRFASIGIDNRDAACEAAKHLLALGHRDIGVIAAFMRYNERSRARLSGVRRALSGVGLGLPEELVTQQLLSFQGGAQGLRTLMDSGSPPSAIFCGNDILAAGALLEAARLGVRVPQDLSICGFDDMDIASALNPGLTTVRVPVADMARKAADCVLRSLEADTVSTRQVVLPCMLIQRGSTGPAPG